MRAASMVEICHKKRALCCVWERGLAVPILLLAVLRRATFSRIKVPFESKVGPTKISKRGAACMGTHVFVIELGGRQYS